MNQTWNNGKVFTMSKRKTSGFLYLKDSNVTLQFNTGDTLNAQQGSIIYLAQNSDYILTFYSCNGETAKTQLIEFELFDNTSTFSVAEKPILICDKNNNFYSDVFYEAINIYEKPVFSYGKFKAQIFSLITDIAERKRHEINNSKEYLTIAPAIDFLEKNIFSDFNISDLAKMCFISEPYFRKIFKSYYFTSPYEYCLNIKINRAKKLLKTRLYTISEVAGKVGYNDAGYFSKVFKKNTGFSPIEYIKK